MRFVLFLFFPIIISCQNIVYTYNNTFIKIGNTIATDTTTDVYYQLRFDPDMWIPDTIYLAEGNSLRIFNDNISFVAIDKRGMLTFTWTSGIGYQDDSSLIIINSVAGTYNAKCIAYLVNRKIDSVSFVVKVEAKKSLGSIKLLAIGNSLTSLGWATMKPQIDDSININLNSLGTRGVSPNKHEGIAGWRYSDFISAGSPFYFSGFKINQYLISNVIDTPDVIRVSLGINECYTNVPTATTVTNATLMIDSILSQLPNTKIIVSLPTSANTTYSETYVKNIRTLNKAIYTKFAYGRYDSNVDINYDNLVINRVSGYAGGDGIHPNDIGYKQLIKGTYNVINHILP